MHFMDKIAAYLRLLLAARISTEIRTLFPISHVMIRIVGSPYLQIGNVDLFPG